MFPTGKRRSVRAVAALVSLCLLGALVLAGTALLPGRAPATRAARSGDVQLRIGGSEPSTWDPALQGDASTAAVLAQVYEGLTAFDAASEVQPALARSWRVEDAGRQLVFQLRSGLEFSDGRPLRAQDVVASWLRLLDPARPSPLAGLLGDVEGATDYLRGRGHRSDVGIRADGETVTVRFRRPAAYFLAAAASPSLAVLASDAIDLSARLPARFVGSGAYVPIARDDDSITLEANPHYWAGPPPLSRIEIVTDLGGRSPVAAFQEGDLDYVGIAPSDASWIRYDRELGPQLRGLTSLSVDYYGFDTTRPPFDDVRVRRAFGAAVDWHRLVRLGNPGDASATSLIPPGIEGRSATDFSPRFDPAAARRLLAEAGYPGGRGFPAVTLVSSGFTADEAVIGSLKDNLSVTVALETMPFDEYFDRLAQDPPAFWSLSWIADYPAPQDFLGLLLETGSDNNYGGWSDAAYDRALEEAATTPDAAEQQRRYDDAQVILQREVPVVPLSYGQGWALSRPDLLGANEAGVGFIRFAGLAWADR